MYKEMKKEDELRDEILRQEGRDVVCDCVHPKKKKIIKKDADQKEETMNMKHILPPTKEVQDIKSQDYLNYEELEDGEIRENDLMNIDNAKG